ncbi:hypothetical protein ACN47E_009051 [Coniothyrium glycines]
MVTMGTEQARLNGTQGHLNNTTSMTGIVEPIAIIGFAHKLPQNITTAEEMWQMLMERRSTMTEVPSNRWNVGGYHKEHGTRAGTVKNRGGHFITDDASRFDAPFFSIQPAEAECMDPQQRFLLETSYHAFENAGIPMEKAMGSKTSVHVGCLLQEYSQISQRDALPGTYQIVGSSGLSMLANRVSWFYDLHGPSMTVDTACSGSLVALHLACQELLAGSVTMALACGSNLCLLPDSCSLLSQLNMMSPDSVCHSFDERANGYSKGEGFGVLVLKRLSQAVADGDTIRALIRSTGVNSDGRTPSITSPNQAAQEHLIRETYAKAGLSLDQTRFFEAHGTGTPVGDPCEASAISNVFSSRIPEDPIYVGALKSNMGHPEGASGVAGVIKTVLALEHGIIPPNVYPERINPVIASKCPTLRFPFEAIQWPTSGVRRASNNSFGYGGTNAHVVIDDALSYLTEHGLNASHCTKPLPRTENQAVQASGTKAPKRNAIEPVPHINGTGQTEILSTVAGTNYMRPSAKLLFISGFDKGAVDRSITKQNDWLRSRDQLETVGADLTDLAYTLSNRRSQFSWKSYSVALPSDVSNLTWTSPGRIRSDTRLCFVFTGQGAQWYGMGRELMNYEVFANSMIKATKHFRIMGSSWSMLDVLYEKHASSMLDNPELSQPICTAVQIAIIDLLASWGVHPNVVVGHSSGEIAAAYACGAISQESAWMISYTRGLSVAVVKALFFSTGAMTAVQTSLEALRPILDEHNSSHFNDRVTLACYNSPTNITLSGSQVAIKRIETMLAAHVVAFRTLNVDVAYHSPHMESAAAVYGRLLHPIQSGNYSQSQPDFISSVTGKVLESTQKLGFADYWLTNLTAPVNFAAALNQIAVKTSRFAADVFLEIGPHCTLRSPVRDILTAHDKNIDSDYCSVLRRGQAADLSALQCAGWLHMAGRPVNITAANDGSNQPGKLLTTLPPYPFNDKTHYWLEGRTSKQYRFRKHGTHELLGTRADDWNSLEARWTNRIILDQSPYLKEHQINGVTIWPAASMLVMAIEAMRQFHEDIKTPRGYKMKNVAFLKAITLSQDRQGTEIQLTLRSTQAAPITAERPQQDSIWHTFSIYVYENGDWHECCTGNISLEARIMVSDNDFEQQNSSSALLVLREVAKNCQFDVESSSIYGAFDKAGLAYGPIFQGMTNVKENRCDQAVGVVNTHHWALQDFDAYCDPHLIHPAILDSMLQMTFPAFGIHNKGASATTVPTGVHSMWISSSLADVTVNSSVVVHAKVAKRGYRNKLYEITAALEGGKDICFAAEMETSTIGRGEVLADQNPRIEQSLYRIDWKPDFDLLPLHSSQGAQGNVGNSTDHSDWLLQEALSQLDLITHKYPSLRILDLSTGSSPSTERVLDTLGGRFAEFIHTNGAIDEVLDMKDKSISSKIGYRALDVSLDPVAQGFELESFDLIIALDICLAAGDARVILSNFRKLLRPGGHVFTTIVAAPEDEWSSKIVELGYDGLHAYATKAQSDESDAAHAFTVLYSRATSPSSNLRVHVIFDEDCPVQSSLVSKIQVTLTNGPIFEVVTVPWRTSHEYDLKQDTCIFLPDIHGKLLSELHSADLEKIKKIVSTAKVVLWVNLLASGPRGNPHTGLISGLVRTLATESTDYRVISLSLNPTGDDASWASSVAKVLQTFDQPRDDYEDEYAEIEPGLLFIPRVVDDRSLMKRVLPKESSLTVTKPWAELERPRLTIGSAGHFDTLHFEQSENASTLLEDNDVVVEIKAVALGKRDLAVALGQVYDESFGNEFAGVVIQTGDTSTIGFKTGDHVLGVGKDAVAQTIRCKASHLQKIPQALSWTVAASLPVNYCTAYLALVEIARVREGDTILVHDSTGDLVQAIIGLAKTIPCTVIVVVESSRELNRLRDISGVPESHVLLSGASNVSDAVRSLTNNIGANVLMTAKPTQSLQKCVAQFGHVIELSSDSNVVAAHREKTSPTHPADSFNIRHTKINFEDFAASALFAEVFKQVAVLFEERMIDTTSILEVFKQSQIQHAFQRLQQSEKSSKIVVEMTDSEVIHMELVATSKTLFNDESSYLIAGAFGGIGRSITLWLARNGAKHLILPSRAAVIGTGSDRESFVQELENMGVVVKAPQCDIADQVQVRRMLDDLSESPQIKGCIQAAAVFKDTSFANMSIENWHEALAPKVHGSWNLHELLPVDLDFFVMLSSSTGIMGSFGQSNYTAGNTYQDALAAHRVKHGQRAHAIALSMVMGAGYVAQNAQVQQLLRVRGMLEEVTLDDIYDILRFCCDSERVDAAQCGSQIITPLTLPADLRALGIVAPLGSTRPLYHYLDTLPSRQSLSGKTSKEKEKLPSATLPGAATLEDAAAIIEQALQLQLSKLLVVGQEDIDAKKAIHRYGVDSLVAVEMRNWFSKGVGADVSTIEILSDVSIQELASRVARKSRFVKEDLRQ